MRDMSAKDWKRVHDTFLQAIDLPAASQGTFITDQLRDAPELAEYALRLLEARARGGDAHDIDDGDLTDSLIGSNLGTCAIKERIGEGSIGAVYLAEQEFLDRESNATGRRPVAIKVIKLGMDTRQIIGRFRHERSVLTKMNHPGIATVFDAGATADGRPYFVMEYFLGEPITRFADRRNLTIAERLKLFCDVCRAVEHAHRKLVIHRDLKPSNILVGEIDGRPTAKVIDFGIAK
ncbi:MAG: serine/threonine protein kinase, partial [Phycisphaerales bacterium]|nr:serine/threonine protein kinase [Phycisphaerales bacterium]